MSTLYEDFMQCQGKWANSYIMKTIRQKHKNGKRAARRWLTRAQLKAHFNDDSVVDAIIVRKEADSELAEKRDQGPSRSPRQGYFYTSLQSSSRRCFMQL